MIKAEGALQISLSRLESLTQDADNIDAIIASLESQANDLK